MQHRVYDLGLCFVILFGDDTFSLGVILAPWYYISLHLGWFGVTLQWNAREYPEDSGDIQ